MQPKAAWILALLVLLNLLTLFLKTLYLLLAIGFGKRVSKLSRVSNPLFGAVSRYLPLLALLTLLATA